MLEQWLKHYIIQNNWNTWIYQTCMRFAGRSVCAMSFFPSLFPLLKHHATILLSTIQVVGLRLSFYRYIHPYQSHWLTCFAVTMASHLTFIELNKLSLEKKSFKAACSLTCQRKNLVSIEFPWLHSVAFGWCTAAAAWNTALPKQKKTLHWHAACQWLSPA